LNKLRLKRETALYTGRDIVVYAAVGTGKKMNFFAEIEDVCRKSEAGNKKNKQQRGFSSMQRTKNIHENALFPSLVSKSIETKVSCQGETYGIPAI
jgi:hypothetical protein